MNFHLRKRSLKGRVTSLGICYLRYCVQNFSLCACTFNCTLIVRTGVQGRAHLKYRECVEILVHCPVTTLKSSEVFLQKHSEIILIIKPTRCTNFSNLFLE